MDFFRDIHNIHVYSTYVNTILTHTPIYVRVWSSYVQYFAEKPGESHLPSPTRMTFDPDTQV